MNEIAPGSGLSRPTRERREETGRPPERRSWGSRQGQEESGGFRGRFRPQRRKVCAFCVDKIDELDYKDVGRLRGYTSERGKILKSRMTGCCAKHQRMVARAIKRAREMALLPFVVE